MSFDEYGDYDELGLAELVAGGEVSPADLVEAAIERIEKATRPWKNRRPAVWL